MKACCVNLLRRVKCGGIRGSSGATIFCLKRFVRINYLIAIIKQMIYNALDEVKTMTTSEQIRVLCTRKGISISELARKIGQTPQNFNAKIKRNSVSDDEIKLICQELGVQHYHYFVMNDDERIE